MTQPQGQFIEFEAQEPTFYARIPKMAIMQLDPFELALYCNLKQTASEDGKCFKSNKTLAQETQMGVTKVKASRASLAQKGFITIERHFDDKGNENTSPIVKIVDVWSKNHNLYSNTPSRHTTTPSHSVTTPGRIMTTPQSPHDPKEEPIKKNPSKNNQDKKIKDSAPVGAGASKSSSNDVSGNAGHTDPLPTPSKVESANANSEPPKPPGSAAPPIPPVAHADAMSIIQAWAEASGAVEDNFYNKKPRNSQAAELWRRCIRPDDVKVYVELLLKDPYKVKNGVKWWDVTGGIVKWKEKNRPAPPVEVIVPYEHIELQIDLSLPPKELQKQAEQRMKQYREQEANAGRITTHE